jgi:hypothetical protein
MRKYVLIAIISWASSQGGVAALSAEFDSAEHCELAAKEIREAADKSNFANVISLGCHEK